MVNKCTLNEYSDTKLMQEEKEIDKGTLKKGQIKKNDRYFQFSVKPNQPNLPL